MVLDNLPSHKVAGVQEAIAARQAQVFYLPPYSPDLDPIEMAFAKLRPCCDTNPRTIDTLIARIGALPGRSRLYRYGTGTPHHAEGVAVSKKCDLVVAVIAGDLTDEQQRISAYRFLDSSTVQAWLGERLEGR